MEHVVGIGEYIISSNPEDVIKTYALASCIAVTVYVADKKIAGLAHIALPKASSNPSNVSPAYFVDKAIPALISNIVNKYICKESDLKIKIFGGADSINPSDHFKIGKKNLDEARRILEDMGLHYESAETGGTVSRTLEICVDDGSITIYIQPITI